MVGYFLLLALLVALPLMRHGFLLTLDELSAPAFDHVHYLLTTADPLYTGRLPVALLLDGLGVVLPGWVVQRIVLLAILAGSGLSMDRASRARTRLGALAAGTVYAINPFVYARLLAGHWWLLLGYAVVPLAVRSFADALDGRVRARRAAVWTAVASAFDPHVAILLVLAYACLGVAAVVRSAPRPVFERGVRVAVLAAGLCSYWLLPAGATLLAGQSKVGAMSGLDLVAFSARGTIDGNVPLSVATLYGFWRGGTRLPVPVLPRWAWLGLFGLVLLSALAGWDARRGDAFADGVLLVGAVAFVLALGVSVPATAPLFRALYDHVVVFRGMRDAQKFVALLVLAYSFLGASGVDRLVGWIDRRLGARDGPDRTGRADTSGRSASLPSRRTLARGLLALVVLVAPLVYTWPMLWGFSGQLHATEYPAGWAATNHYLQSDGGDYRVLALPWHQYLTFPWTDGRVANPTDAYFDRPIVRSRSIEVAGIDAQAASPTHERVSAILAEPAAAEPIGASLAPLGVKYVLLVKAVDYRRYDYLRRQPDLVVVEENDDVVLLENRAFASAPPPTDWPRAWPVVPRRALVAGVLVSLGTAFAPVVRRRAPAIPRLDAVR